MADSSAPVPRVALISDDGTNEGQPQVELLFHNLLQRTHNKIKSSPRGGAPNFVIFTPDDSMAYILDLYNIYCIGCLCAF